jgi:hypothetical protein
MHRVLVVPWSIAATKSAIEQTLMGLHRLVVGQTGVRAAAG